MSFTTRLPAILLVASTFLFATTRQAQAQCQGGRPMSGSMQQGRLQTTMQQQSLFQAAMNQQQQNAFNTALQQQQQNGLVGIMQQQQQVAMLAALQQLQQNRQLLALQQQQNAILVNQPQQQNLAASPTPRQRRIRLIEDSEDILPAVQRQSLDAQSDEEIAAARLKMAKDLAGDADQAQAQGDRRRAAILRERAGNRLQNIVESFQGTPSAEQAKMLLQTLNR